VAGAIGLALAAGVSTTAAAEDSPAPVGANPPAAAEQAVTPLATPVCTTYMTIGVPSRWIPSLGDANTVANRKCQLGRDNVSGAVVRLQQALAHCNAFYPIDDFDGVYGPNTQNGVRITQGFWDMAIQDGLYGPQTHNAMEFDGPTHERCSFDTVRNL
jgi:hypothetical protein